MRVTIILNAAVVVPVDGSQHSLIVCSDEHVCVCYWLYSMWMRA